MPLKIDYKRRVNDQTYMDDLSSQRAGVMCIVKREPCALHHVRGDVGQMSSNLISLKLTK